MVTRGQSENDRSWGRIGAAQPPLPAAAPLVSWLAGAIVLTVVVLGFVRGPGPLDDPDEGDQRPGLLFDVDEARSVPQLELPGDPVGRMVVVVAFDRRVSPPQRLRSFTRDVPDDVAVVLVIPEPVNDQPRLPSGVQLLAGTGSRIADAVGMPEPSDGAAPVGYAVLDRQGRVRSATLDPEYEEHGSEVEIIAGALR